MNRTLIGKKIKTQRLKLGLTQKQLTDGYMTRNMLSLIESGAALPSLESLEYISSKLNVPVAFLLSDEDEAPPLKSSVAIEDIRKLFTDGSYAMCIEALESIEEHNCETLYLLAYSYFYRGKALTENGSFTEAERLLKAALQKCRETAYDTSGIESTIPLYLAIVSNFQSPMLELDTESYEKRHLCAFEYELYKYISSDFEFDFTNAIFKLHIEAKSLIKKYRFSDAIVLLKEIEEMKSSSFNAFVYFGVYTDLENCYKQVGDFENAYRYSSKRLNLINVFGEKEY